MCPQAGPHVSPALQPPAVPGTHSTPSSIPALGLREQTALGHQPACHMRPGGGVCGPSFLIFCAPDALASGPTPVCQPLAATTDLSQDPAFPGQTHRSRAHTGPFPSALTLTEALTAPCPHRPGRGQTTGAAPGARGPARPELARPRLSNMPLASLGNHSETHPLLPPPVALRGVR